MRFYPPSKEEENKHAIHGRVCIPIGQIPEVKATAKTAHLQCKDSISARTKESLVAAAIQGQGTKRPLRSPYPSRPSPITHATSTRNRNKNKNKNKKILKSRSRKILPNTTNLSTILRLSSYDRKTLNPHRT